MHGEPLGLITFSTCKCCSVLSSDLNGPLDCFGAQISIIFLFYFLGIYLYPASDLTVENFTIICDLETTMTNFITFNYNGNAAGVCPAPSGGSSTCGSAIANITTDLQTVKFILDPKEVLSKGNALWICSHGAVEANYTAVVTSK